MTDNSDHAIRGAGVRFHRFFQSKGFNASEVSALLGKSPSTLSKMVNGERFSSKLLVEIKVAFPNLNLRWLLLDEGQMVDYQQILNVKYEDQLQTLKREYERIISLPIATTNKQVKEQVEALQALFDKALDLRFRMVSEQVDLYQNLLTA